MTIPHIPAGALEALRAIYGGTAHDVRYGRLLFDLNYETVGLEAAPEGVLLGLARDCPFDEIAPALLAVFLHQVQELAPDVRVQHVNGYGHPIVARLPVILPPDAPAAAWSQAFAEVLPRLDATLKLQREAVERFQQVREGSFDWEWPDVAVTPEQVHQLAGLADAYAPSKASVPRGIPDPELIKLEQLLTHYGVIDRRASWVKWLQLRDLEMGDWHDCLPQNLKASQLVVLLRALFDGARYSHPCLNALIGRAYYRPSSYAAGSSPAEAQIQYGVRPLPSDIGQKRPDPLLAKVFVRFFGPDLVGDGLDVVF
jgi:hypothetical protein